MLTAMPLPQYVLGTISPKPTLRKVIAISHIALSRFACSSSWNLKRIKSKKNQAKMGLVYSFAESRFIWLQCVTWFLLDVFVHIIPLIVEYCNSFSLIFFVIRFYFRVSGISKNWHDTHTRIWDKWCTINHFKAVAGSMANDKRVDNSVK